MNDLVLYVDYKENGFIMGDDKIICLEGSSDLLGTEILENGNIKFSENGDGRNYNNDGIVKVSGRFYWKTPIYDYHYSLMNEIRNWEYNTYNFEFVRDMSKDEVQQIISESKVEQRINYEDWYESKDLNWSLDPHESVFYIDNDTIIHRSKYIKEWANSDVFTLTNKPLKFKASVKF